MSASTKTRNLIGKLLRLAQSPEPAEAARAREEAERLMKKHGLTEAEFEEDVIEVADDKRDDLRQRLAYAVGVSRRCVCNKKHDIRFRGRSSDVASACRLYKALLSAVTSNCEIGPSDPGRDVWRICFWSGFIEVVVDRLIDDEARLWRPQEEQPTPSEVAVMGPPKQVSDEQPSVAVELQRAVDDFAQHFDPAHQQRGIAELRKAAREAGKSLGSSVYIEPRESKKTHRAALGEGSEHDHS